MKRAALAVLAILLATLANAQGNFPNPQFVPSWDNHGKFALVPPYPGNHLKFLRGDGVWDTLGSADAPSGPTGYIQYNAGGTFGGTPLPPSGILKGGPGPSFLNAVAGTDYLAPNGNGSGLIGLLASQIGSVPAGVLKGSGGAFAAAVSGTDYSPATSGNGILKGNGAGGTAGATSTDLASLGASSTTPSVDGTAAVGTSNTYARADHVHPTDTSRAPTASPAFTGTPTTPTAAVDTNTTQIASTAFVVGQAASATPLIDGTAAAGTSTRFARGDHVHPTDTSRAPVASPTFTGTPAGPTAAVDTNTTQLASTGFVLGQAASATPLIDGSAAAGTSTRYARADHVHPTDTSRAALASPTFTGTPAAPTAAVDTNTTQLATTAFVLGQAASASPLVDGTAAAGTSTRYARADHVHPTDTSRAALASPTFTGIPAAPTAAVDTNTTQLSTTAFVLAQAASATPLIDGTAAAGTSTRYARADHIHPTDTTRAPTASPSFTGTVSNTGKIASTLAITTDYTIDATGASTVALATGASATLVNGSGFILANSGTGGNMAAFLLGGGNVGLILQVNASGVSTWAVNTSTPAAGQISLYYDGTHYIVKSNLTSSTTPVVSGIKLSASN